MEQLGEEAAIVSAAKVNQGNRIGGKIFVNSEATA